MKENKLLVTVSPHKTPRIDLSKRSIVEVEKIVEKTEMLCGKLTLQLKGVVSNSICGIMEKLDEEVL